MKEQTDLRLKKAKDVSKDTLIDKIKNNDSVRFDQMLIESEERKTYFYVKYNSIAFTRTPYVLKFPLFKDLVNDFEKSINDNGEITILENENFIQKIKSKGKRYFEDSDNSQRVSNLDKAKNISSNITDTYSSIKGASLTSVVGSAISAGVDKMTEKKSEVQPNSTSNLGYYIPKLNSKFSSEKLVFSELKIITENDKVKLKQPLYYIPNETERCTCGTCDGDKYTTCTVTECRGQHIYDCNKCRTSGKIDCDDCNAKGQYTCPSCNGKGSLKCSGCGGSGRDKNSNSILAKCKDCNGSGERKCSSYNKTGSIKSNTGGATLIGGVANLAGAAMKKVGGNEYCGGTGVIKCKTCNESGSIICDKCEGDGRIECKTCYGDHQDNRFGKVDCITCETAGELASISYIETEIKTDNLDLIFTDGKKIEAPNFDVNTIKKFVNPNGKLISTYKNLNGDSKENYDEHSTFCSKNGLTQLGNSKDKYPKLISEEMYYEGVPCVTFNYNHILSASFHDVSVLSIDKEQEIFYHSNPADVAEEKESFIEKIKELCRKAFSTKAFKDKVDRKHEMFLMIHMAKADGIIEEQEKRYLSQTITGLQGFTTKEKSNIFDLMSSNSLPPISPNNAYFSTKERAEEAKKKIVELVAKADGEYESEEKTKLEEINAAIEQGFKVKPTAIGQFFKTWQISVSLFFILISLACLTYYALVIVPEKNSARLISAQQKLEDSMKKNSTEIPNTAENKTIVSNETKSSPKEIINSDVNDILLGTWVGEMSNKKLTIVIEKVAGNEVFGYNILGSNRRNLKGTLKEGAWDQACSKAFDVTLNEPGDDKWDGVFNVKFVGYQDEEETDDGLECSGKYSGVEASGSWKANNGKSTKDFTLTKEN